MSPLIVVVLIVLVDLLGFSIVMPLLPPFAEQYGFSRTQIGMLLAAYPMCQLIAGPILGRLSDRYGRRPVLAVSQAGTALSFLILGLTHNYWIMLVARMLDGASGGNILVAQAYIADVTEGSERSKGMGLIGAAFGVGFTLGPLLGGLILSLPIDPELRLRLPFLIAAGLSTIAWILVLTRLPESMSAENRGQARVIRWQGVLDLVKAPQIGLLVGVASLTVLAFSALEGTFSLFLKERMGWNPAQAAYAFAYVGIISAVVQGGLLRRLIPKYGEPRLIVVGLAALCVGLVGVALAGSLGALMAAVLVLTVGQALAGPTTTGLLSRVTPPSEQGAVFGTLVSAQTLARMVNYLAANRLLERAGPAAPYFEAAVIAGVALLLAGYVLTRWIGFGPVPRPGAVTTASPGA